MKTKKLTIVLAFVFLAFVPFVMKATPEIYILNSTSNTIGFYFTDSHGTSQLVKNISPKQTWELGSFSDFHSKYGYYGADPCICLGDIRLCDVYMDNYPGDNPWLYVDRLPAPEKSYYIVYDDHASGPSKVVWGPNVTINGTVYQPGVQLIRNPWYIGNNDVYYVIEQLPSKSKPVNI